MQDITKIVVPVDLEKHTQKVVDFAIYMAGKIGAHISLIHVTEFYSPGDMMLGSPSLETLNNERVERAQETMNNLLEDNKRTYQDMSGTVLKGEIVETIVKFAADEESGLLIIGTHGAKGLEKILLGSVAERVLKRVHCPTLTMNPYK
jgi:nucleotide-binding universal stress UspA family protein